VHKAVARKKVAKPLKIIRAVGLQSDERRDIGDAATKSIDQTSLAGNYESVTGSIAGQGDFRLGGVIVLRAAIDIEPRVSRTGGYRSKDDLNHPTVARHHLGSTIIGLQEFKSLEKYAMDNEGRSACAFKRDGERRALGAHGLISEG
jgi:hypothetical protein